MIVVSSGSGTATAEFVKKHIPPPPKFSPEEERLAKQVLAEREAKKKPLAPQLTPDERKAKKSAKRRRQKDERKAKTAKEGEDVAETSDAEASTAGAATVSVPSQSPRADPETRPGSAAGVEEEASGPKGAGKGNNFVDEGTGKYPDGTWEFRCCVKECARLLSRSCDFLLLDKPDWCGRLWGKCYECSKEDFGDEASFMTAARNSHKKLNTDRKIRADRVKDVVFKGKRSVMEHIMKGASKNAIRQATLDFIKAVAMQIAHDVSSDPVLKEFTKANVARYVATVEHQERHGGTCSTDGSKLDSTTLGWATFISAKVGLCWLCRHCGFVGWNHLWVQLPGREKRRAYLLQNIAFVCRVRHGLAFRACARRGPRFRSSRFLAPGALRFKCPCGIKYQPWVEGKGVQTKAQKAIVYPDNSGKMVITLIKWPSSAEDAFFNRQVEAYAERLEAIQNPDAWLNRSMGELTAYAEKCGNPCGWQRFDWPAGIDYSPYKRPDVPFYEGAIVPDLANQKVEEDLDMVIALLGNVLGGVKAKQRGSK